jgi:hypothetical protein
MTGKRLTISKVRRAAAKAGGRVEPDGCGGYELIAPYGYRWASSETVFQPIPLNEAQDADSRQEMLRWAMDCATGGLEPITEE